MSTASALPLFPPPRAVESRDLMVLTEIYQDDVNLVRWRSPGLDPAIPAFLHNLALQPVRPQVTAVLPAHTCADRLAESFPKHPARPILVDWLMQCIDLFACLFEQRQVGVRFRWLNTAMCPRFHVDNIPVRLVHTLDGPGTEWLTEENLDRSRLGRGSGGLPDERSCVVFEPRDIQRLHAGDVALLKGSGWAGNEHGGLVHRSPAVASVTGRWVLTLDLAD